MARERMQGVGLLEIVFGISLLGIVLAVAIPTFLRTVRTSKLAEAGEEITAMQRAVVSYYVGAKPSQSRRCLPETAGPTPAEASVDPIELDFHAPATPGSETWKAIGYRPKRPIRYRYTLAPNAAGCRTGASEETRGGVVLRAEGDLDGDGTLSSVELTLVDENGSLVARGAMRVRDRVE